MFLKFLLLTLPSMFFLHNANAIVKEIDISVASFKLGDTNYSIKLPNEDTKSSITINYGLLFGFDFRNNPYIEGWSFAVKGGARSEEHTSELQSHHDLVC